MKTEYNMGFDYSHQNKLMIEDPGFNDFIEYLINSDLKLGKIEAGITYEKLSNYNVFIIGVPGADSYISSEEIEYITKYVKDGGSILIINDKGGDIENKNNLNELAKTFGIKFNPDQLFDNENFSKDISRPIIKDFKKHYITRDITQIIHSNGCTLKIDESIETEDKDVSAILLLATQINNFYKLRAHYENYLEELEKETCPNFMEVGGATIAAKLLSHAGSLKRLVEMPASTIQILGAEKALFRHMRNKRKNLCPKFGLIHEHQLIQKSKKEMHGKVARALADKLSIAVKIDYFKGKFIGDKLKKGLVDKFKIRY